MGCLNGLNAPSIKKDRTVPTTVREYFMEVRGESGIWQKMPRRMLRHRALQQCVMLAMGMYQSKEQSASAN